MKTRYSEKAKNARQPTGACRDVLCLFAEYTEKTSKYVAFFGKGSLRRYGDERNNMEKQDVGHCHKDHRKRLKTRFLQEGLRNFEPHNILELLLFYAIPQKDTNDLAHALLQRYKSISGVFDADYEDLLRQDGIGESTATLLKLIAPLSRVYQTDKSSRYEHFDTLDQIGEYLLNYYIGETREVCVMMLFNNKMELIRTVRLAEGTVTASDVNIRKIVEIGLRYQAAFFVLAHNHPDGNADPSDDDVHTTIEIRRAVERIDLPMLEHIVVGRERFVKLLHPHDRGLAVMPTGSGE